MYSITTIENAFLTALAPLKDNGTIKTLATYGGELQLTAEKSAERIASLVKQFPAVFVAWDGAEIEWANEKDAVTIHMLVVVCDRNLQGEESARRGDVGNPGVYALLGECRTRLHRQYVVTGWPRVRLVDEQPLAYDPTKSLAIYAARYQVNARLTWRQV
jgi:phage gp37-like protein